MCAICPFTIRNWCSRSFVKDSRFVVGFCQCAARRPCRRRWTVCCEEHSRHQMAVRQSARRKYSRYRRILNSITSNTVYFEHISTRPRCHVQTTQNSQCIVDHPIICSLSRLLYHLHHYGSLYHNSLYSCTLQ